MDRFRFKQEEAKTEKKCGNSTPEDKALPDGKC